MKTLIVEVIDTKRIGELVTVGRIFGDTPDIVVLGTGDIPGTYTMAYCSDTAVGANLIDALVNLIRNSDYQLVLLSATTVGAEIAGPLSVGLHAPVLTEVVGASADMTVTRPIYGGKAMATHKISQVPTILTVRRKYFEPADLEGVAIPVPLNSAGAAVTLLDESAVESQGIPLEDAEIIASGGRGVGSGENFSMLRETAAILKAAVGASRGAVDEGWAAPTMQIGQTGNIVAPSVYFAVGISGASQHLAGIANAKCVVAINKDEDANIFKRARFGIVEDYKKVVPALIQALKEEQ